MIVTDGLSEDDYRALAELRLELRRFLRFSEQAAIAAGLTPQQHQALLAIRSAKGSHILVGELAERLLLKPHSASELVRRMARHGMVARRRGEPDRRQIEIELTARAEALLDSLSFTHREELRRLRPIFRHLLEAL